MGTFLREILRFGVSSRERSVEWQICSHLRKHGTRYLGNTDAGKGYCFIRPASDMSVVFGCYAGRGQVLIDQQWQWCGLGHVFLTPAHVPHAYRTVPGTRWGIVWVA